MCIRLRIMPLSEDWTVTAGRSFLSMGRRILPRAFLVAQLALSGLALTAATAYAASEPRPSSASIRTPDFDESVQWYQDNLGFRLIGSQSLVPGRRAVLERSGFLLEINEVDHVLQPEPDSTAAVQPTRAPVVSIIVPDVDREVARLRRAGVDILQLPEDELDGTYRTAQIQDNGRHRIELREPLDPAAGFNAGGR